MENGFVKNEDILKEDYRVKDLLDFSGTISKFNAYLSKIKNHSLIGIIGGYGTGKSTMLYQLEKQNPNKWIVFDAWAFPNRKDLWENFVLDFAKQIDHKLFLETLKKIDGNLKDGIAQFIKVLFTGIGILLSTIIDPCLSGLSFGKKFAYFFKSSPAKRIFEFKEILKELIKKQECDLFIVLEDADRAGQEGIIFLETIKQFILKELADYKEHKITFIVPIGGRNYEDSGYETSYRKIIDYIFEFEPEINFEKFVEEVFVESKEEKTFWKENLNQLCKFFVRSGKTIRDLKLVLRMANNSYARQLDIENFEPDARISILIEMHDELKDEYATTHLKNDIRKIQMLASSSRKFYGFFMAALQNNEAVENVYKAAEQTGIYKRPDIVFAKNHSLNFPKQWLGHQEGKNWVKLSDLYLKKSWTEI